MVMTSTTTPRNVMRKTRSTMEFQNASSTNERGFSEEQHDDVIYNVKLKRISRSLTSDEDGLLWATHKVRYIKGATLEHLVAHLLRSFVDDQDTSPAEKNFAVVFLATFRSYVAPAQLLDQMQAECMRIRLDGMEKNRAIFRSAEKVLRTWVERHFREDFCSPPDHPLLRKMIGMVEEFHQIGSEEDEDGSSDAGDAECEFVGYLRRKLRTAEDADVDDGNGNSDATASPTESLAGFHNADDDDDVNHDDVNMDACKILLHDLSPPVVAHQLTIRDAHLLMDIVPHACLTAVRSSKRKPACVRATIEQFNRVVYSVLATCLQPALKCSQRAKIFCKWIEVAEYCREVKNFSSLRAIVSGLRTHDLHRLKRTWQHVPNSHLNLLAELDATNTKDLLFQVGTGKMNNDYTFASRIRRDLAKLKQQRRSSSNASQLHGTVPYLGSFLTDLTYLHTALPDYVQKRLINFEKRRKEFEHLAQLQLWQASCKGYRQMATERAFDRWFSSITLLSDAQTRSLSEQIEPPIVPTANLSPNILRHHRLEPKTPEKRASASSLPALMLRKSSSDISATYQSHPNSPLATQNGGSNDSKHRWIVFELFRRNGESSEEKSMELSPNHRTGHVMKEALKLFDVEHEDDQFSLVQLLPGNREFEIPSSANVFYAMNSSADDFRFALLENGAQIVRATSPTSSQRGASPIPNVTSTEKPKKHHRKSLSASSLQFMAASTVALTTATSPIKSVLGQLNKSGSYSPSRADPAAESDRRWLALDDCETIVLTSAATTDDDARTACFDFADSGSQHVYNNSNKVETLVRRRHFSAQEMVRRQNRFFKSQSVSDLEYFAGVADDTGVASSGGIARSLSTQLGYAAAPSSPLVRHNATRRSALSPAIAAGSKPEHVVAPSDGERIPHIVVHCATPPITVRTDEGPVTRL